MIKVAVGLVLLLTLSSCGDTPAQRAATGGLIGAGVGAGAGALTAPAHPRYGYCMSPVIVLVDLLQKSAIGTRSYPAVIPDLIREVMRLRRELQRERMWNATREAAASSWREG